MAHVELCKWTSDASGRDTVVTSGLESPPLELESVDYAVTSLKDVAKFESRDSVYTVDRTYSGLTVIKFDAHIDRLEDSAIRESIDLQFDRADLRRVLRMFFEKTRFDLIRFRIAVARSEPRSFYLAAEEFFPPSSELIDSGVRCSILEGAVRRNPAAKTADWMLDRDQFSQPSWAYDGLLIGENREILEGATSNFYAILNDRLYTANTGVLLGIARQIVIEVAGPILPVELSPIRQSDLSAVSGCFLTSASRGIIPVVQIGDEVIGDGTPSRLTRQLQADYDRWVENHREPL